MKNIYKRVFILILPFLVSGFVQAQSLTATGVFIAGDPLFLMEGHVNINNVSGSDKDVLVERRENLLFSGHLSYFCWVQCYGYQTSVSPDPVPIPAGGFTDIFRGDLETNAIPGVDTVTYCFYVQTNPSDSVCVRYIFDSTVGIPELPANKNYISKPQPNPAGSSTTFYVNVAKASRSAQIKIFNMLGTEVKSVDVSDTRGSVKLNFPELRSGIYFYSLFVDGKASGTGKLMITRN